ncbi:MAG: thioredoxin fold domain-containing protein [Ignavibacteriales bacterium]|nr:thioredoxin fold domain-containing protein [Ignavibacteriales bacterium]
MKNKILFLTLLTIYSINVFAGGKTEPKWYKYDAGVIEANKTNKKILLDVYTDWCKWCKKLDAEVYGNDKVTEYLNKHFISIKINGESESTLKYKGKTISEQQLAGMLGVTGFPTIMFLDSKGEPIDKLGGFVPADKFLPIIKFLGEDHYKKISWDEFYKDYTLNKSKK